MLQCWSRFSGEPKHGFPQRTETGWSVKKGKNPRHVLIKGVRKRRNEDGRVLSQVHEEPCFARVGEGCFVHILPLIC